MAEEQVDVFRVSPTRSLWQGSPGEGHALSLLRGLKGTGVTQSLRLGL